MKEKKKKKKENVSFFFPSRFALSQKPPKAEKKRSRLTAKRFRPDSFAAARASSVLEHPGGPNSRIPAGGATPRSAGFFGTEAEGEEEGAPPELRVAAVASASCRRALAARCPPTSPHRARGSLSATERIAEGRTTLRAASKSSLVTTRSGQSGSTLPKAEEEALLFTALRSARPAASLASRARSAPTKPCAASARRRTSLSVSECLRSIPGAESFDEPGRAQR